VLQINTNETDLIEDTTEEETGQTLASIRVSDNKQDVKKQQHEILEAARLKNLTIDDFVSMTLTSRETAAQQRIDEVLARLTGGYADRHRAIKVGAQHRRDHFARQYACIARYPADRLKTAD
jgi:hypothetical protein